MRDPLNKGNPHSHTYECKSHAQRNHTHFSAKAIMERRDSLKAPARAHLHARIPSSIASSQHCSPDIWNRRWLDEGNPRSHTYEGNPHSQMCASNLHTWIARGQPSRSRSISLSLHTCNIRAPDRSIWQRDRAPAQAQGTFSDVVVLATNEAHILNAQRLLNRAAHAHIMDDTRDLHAAKGVSLTCGHTGVSHYEVEACRRNLRVVQKRIEVEQ